MRILALDPGSEQTGWILTDRGLPLDSGKHTNEDVLAIIGGSFVDVVVIESMSPRGMPTSKQEMETMFWAGRFAQNAVRAHLKFDRITRDDVKFHLCGRRNGTKDSNVRAALIDRYGGVGGKAAAIGVKARRGPLYGIAGDAWAALAVAVTFEDTRATLSASTTTGGAT